MIKTLHLKYIISCLRRALVLTRPEIKNGRWFQMIPTDGHLYRLLKSQLYHVKGNKHTTWSHACLQRIFPQVVSIKQSRATAHTVEGFQKAKLFFFLIYMWSAVDSSY